MTGMTNEQALKEVKSLLASHKDYTESQARGWPVRKEGYPDHDWSMEVEEAAAPAIRHFAALIARNAELEAALQWYVENDDTNVGQEGNEFYEAGLHRAQALLEPQKTEPLPHAQEAQEANNGR